MKGLFSTRESLNLICILFFNEIAVEEGEGQFVVKEMGSGTNYKFLFASDTFDVIKNDLKSLQLLFCVCYLFYGVQVDFQKIN